MRELKNIIERAAYRDLAGEIGPADLGLALDAALPSEGKFQDRVDAFCRQLLQQAMAQSGGNRAEAARALGLSYHKLRYVLAKHLGHTGE